MSCSFYGTYNTLLIYRYSFYRRSFRWHNHIIGFYLIIYNINEKGYIKFVDMFRKKYNWMNFCKSCFFFKKK